MDSLSLKPDLKALLRSSIFLFRIASIIFSMIILACIDRDGYFLGHCVFYSGGSACGFALTVASLGFIFCFVYIIVDTLFLGIPQPYRKYIVMFDLGFDCFWTFIFFVLFCNMANHWQFSDAKPEVLNQINTNNVRAAIAFVFFSVISWAACVMRRGEMRSLVQMMWQSMCHPGDYDQPKGGTSYAVYRRYASIQNYNQYADDVTDVNQGHTGADVGSGYIDYFNQPPAPVQSGFDASMAADDEFISGGGQHLAGDTELLTS